MNTPDRRWHPYVRTQEEDLHILADGRETGWWDDNARPAPWPEDFLHPTAGWTTNVDGDDPENPHRRPRKPAILATLLTRQENPPHWPEN